MSVEWLMPRFASLQAFLEMGGYAPYVWSAWLFGVLAPAVVWVRARREWQRVRRDLDPAAAVAGWKREADR